MMFVRLVFFKQLLAVQANIDGTWLQQYLALNSVGFTHKSYEPGDFN